METAKVDLTGYVDITSAQTISGVKTFSGGRIPMSYHTLKDESNIYFKILLGNNDQYLFSNTAFFNMNNYDLGTTTRKWKDLYLSGKINSNSSNYGLSLPDTTNFTANKEIATTDLLYGLYATPSGTELSYVYINNMSLSADTTLTLATAPANSYPEYKANITNTDTSNAITITLPSGTKILTNDDNIVISSNTFTIPADTSVELNIQNGCAVVVNFEVA